MYRGRQGPHRTNRSYIENLTVPLPDHLLVDWLSHGEQAAHVRINHLIPRAIGGGGKIVAAIDGGIVDQDIDPAPFVDQIAGQVLHAETIYDRHLERLAF